MSAVSDPVVQLQKDILIRTKTKSSTNKVKVKKALTAKHEQKLKIIESKKTATDDDDAEYLQVPEIGTVVQGSFWLNNQSAKNDILRHLHDITLDEAIGQGSFGTVVKILAGKAVAALKCVQKSESPEDQERELLKVKCEFNSWNSVSSHPNVVTLLGYFETDRNWCFLMEFAPNGNLSQHLKEKGGPLSVQLSQRLTGQIAHALHCVHLMGFLHRDLSCSNILLSQVSKNPDVFDARITDFGLSMRGRTSSSRCGSLAYMSPEVLEKSPYSTGADWWSFGIVAYAMFVGETPLALYARKRSIDLITLSREKRYKLAKNITIHISRKLTSEQRTLLIDLLKDDQTERLGVKKFKNGSVEVEDTFECFRKHPFFTGFEWDELTRVQKKLIRQKSVLIGDEDLQLPASDTQAPCSPKLRLPHDRSYSA